MRAAVLALALAAMTAAGCSEVGPFYCDNSDQCTFEDDDGTIYMGTCVIEYFACAYPDPMCDPSMLRYDDSADEVGGLCVGQEQ